MKTWFPIQRSFTVLLILKLLLALGLSASAAINPPKPLDVNGDNIPDIWALRYQAAALNPADDSDGDGATNASESFAGTDPLASGSVIRVSSITIDIAGVHLTFPTLPGKRYRVQESISLASGTWSDIGALHAGTGGEVEATVAAADTTKFFRVYVLDVDTDNDGVTDYEEILAGYNPNSPSAFGAGGLSDKDALIAALNPATVNTVSVQAADDAATEPSPEDTGLFVIKRVGKLTPITVNFTVAGSAVEGDDYSTITRSVSLPFGVNSTAVLITPQADSLVESPESVILTIAPGTDYAPPTAATQPAAVLIHDRTSPNGTGLLGRYWNEVNTGVNIISATNPAKFSGPPLLTRTDATVNFYWPNGAISGSPGSGVRDNHWSARWMGEVLPEFSQIYTFFLNANDATRVWVNGKLLINGWPRSQEVEVSGTIELLAGVRVPIVIEFYEITNNARAELRWQCQNLPKEIIPTARLFPAVPPQILSPLDVMLIQNSPPYTYQIVASGEPTSYAASNLPPGWTINTATGLISGTPDTAGIWPILLTATNAHGSGSEILNLSVIATGNQITREVWSNIPGTSLSSIPLSAPPNTTSLISNLNAPQNDGEDFGARIRGTITAPTTGSYRFWISASDTAELWISNDTEEINAFRRAMVTTPTSYQGWTDNGKSDFIWLEAGQPYYIEVRHKAGIGDDHVSVGWLKPTDGGVDPTDDIAPAEVVPSYVLSPYVAPSSNVSQGLLFQTNLTPQKGITTSASGNFLLRLSEDETEAIITINYSNLSTPYFGMHLHDPNIPGGGLSNVICDFDEPGDVSRNPDGTWHWVIKPRGGYSVAQLVDHIKNPTNMGSVYFNVHSLANTGGEIRGDLKRLEGSQTFSPPAAPPAPPADHTDANAAARFLTQATFGVHGSDSDTDGTPDSIEEVQNAASYEAWIDAQIALPPTLSYPYVFTNRNLTSPSVSTYQGDTMFRSWWKNSITAPDQLRQRVAFALSEILVISEAGPLDDKADAVSDFYDTLLHYSLGDPAYVPPVGAPPADGTFHNLLKAVTLHPAMGRYLDMLRNDKPDIVTGRIPNENYAREVLQLFSIGLYRQWPDGSLMLNSKVEPIPTYGQDEVIGFSHVFTGWGYHYAGNINAASNSITTAGENWLDPMREIPRRHFIGSKRILNNVILPGLPAVGGVAINPNVTHTQTQYENPAYIGLPAVELEASLKQISNHPNTAPFICRQLIQRLVTSTPSRAYVYRVVQKFNDNGSGVYGDMKAVVKAILLDHEARSSSFIANPKFGKQREPIARIAAIARAFPAPAAINGTYTQTGNLINVTVSPPVTITNGNNVYLDFNGATPSDVDDAAYTVSNVSTVGNETTFTVRPRSTETNATYSQTAASLVINVPDEHTFNTTSNSSVYLDFTSGATPPDDGVFTVTSAYKVSNNGNDYFTVPAPMAQRATYVQAAGSQIITVTFPAGHGYELDQPIQIHIDFVTAGAPSGLFTVTPTSPTQLTFNGADTPAAARSGNANVIKPIDIVTRSGALVATRESYTVNRTGGTVALTFSDWGLNDTDNALGQTPMRSPTVFNFFEPDYRYPGILTKAGLITPEFQITSDTTVMRQANFIYDGFFGSGNTNGNGGNNDLHGIQGLSSFVNAGRDIALDFRPWMGVGPGGLPWLHNDNLGAFIDKMNVLLMAGQLPSTGTNDYGTNPRNIVNAKAAIINYVQTLPYGRTATNVTTSGLTSVTTSIAHNFTTGQSVTINGITGFTANNSTLTVTGPNTFTVPVTCTTVPASYATATATPSGGSPISISGLQGYCSVSVSNHGFATGQIITITGVTGGAFTPAINGTHVVLNTGNTGSFLIPVTRTSNVGQNNTNARVGIPGGFPDLLRDRVKSVIHLMVTSPDFTIQK